MTNVIKYLRRNSMSKIGHNLRNRRAGKLIVNHIEYEKNKLEWIEKHR